MVKKLKIKLERATLDHISKMDDDCSLYVAYKKGITIYTIIGKDESIGIINDTLFGFKDGEMTHKINVDEIEFMFSFKE